MHKVIKKSKDIPWSANFIRSNKIKSWLQLADFELESDHSILYRPPFFNKRMYEKLNSLEQVGKYLFPVLGGVYVLMARAKVVPLTPIRLKWKQQLSGIRIRPITGHIARRPHSSVG